MYAYVVLEHQWIHWNKLYSILFNVFQYAIKSIAWRHSFGSIAFINYPFMGDIYTNFHCLFSYSIYVDAVFNHMTTNGTGTGSDGSYFSGDSQFYPQYRSRDFNGPDECPTADLEIAVSQFLYHICPRLFVKNSHKLHIRIDVGGKCTAVTNSL